MSAADRWFQPPFVAVRRTRDGVWIWEARDRSYRSEVRSEREFKTLAAAQRAAKKVAAERAWPMITLPVAPSV